MVGQGNDLPDTQVATQSQTSQIWQDIQSQPVQNAWGRLLPKNLQIKSLGTMNTRPIYVIKESSHIFGKIYFLQSDVCIFLLRVSIFLS